MYVGIRRRSLLNHVRARTLATDLDFSASNLSYYQSNHLNNLHNTYANSADPAELQAALKLVVCWLFQTDPSFARWIGELGIRGGSICSPIDSLSTATTASFAIRVGPSALAGDSAARTFTETTSPASAMARRAAQRCCR